MTDTTLESPLRRLHRALVEALRERDPAGLERPFTVAEIYQDLVPYRTHRDVLGVEMNGDYEHLVLRLLAGEEGLVVLESDHARREIESELERTNPNTGLYREYAAVDVHLVADSIPSDDDLPSEEAVILPAPDEGSGSPVVGAGEEEATSVDELAPGTEEESMDEVEEAAAPTAEEDAASLPGDDGVCYWCRGTLPLRDNLNFCPFCGTDVSVVPCGACGEAVEPGWRFCIQCGAPSGEG